MAETLAAPPEKLEIAPALRTLGAGSLLSRIFFASGAYAVRWNSFRHFGPLNGRFDHHALGANGFPQEDSRGIMYVATGEYQFPVTLAEVFQGTRMIDRYLNTPTYTAFRLKRDIVLLDLTGTFPTAAGGSMAIHTGNREIARQWSRLFYLTYPQIDGLYYCSSMHSRQPVAALYERSGDALPDKPEVHRALADSALQNLIFKNAEQIGFDVL